MIWSYTPFQIPFSRALNAHNTHHSNIHFDFSIDRERMRALPSTASSRRPRRTILSPIATFGISLRKYPLLKMMQNMKICFLPESIPTSSISFLNPAPSISRLLELTYINIIRPWADVHVRSFWISPGYKYLFWPYFWILWDGRFCDFWEFLWSIMKNRVRTEGVQLNWRLPKNGFEGLHIIPANGEKAHFLFYS